MSVYADSGLTIVPRFRHFRFVECRTRTSCVRARVVSSGRRPNQFSLSLSLFLSLPSLSPLSLSPWPLVTRLCLSLPPPPRRPAHDDQLSRTHAQPSSSSAERAAVFMVFVCDPFFGEENGRCRFLAPSVRRRSPRRQTGRRATRIEIRDRPKLAMFRHVTAGRRTDGRTQGTMSPDRNRSLFIIFKQQVGQKSNSVSALLSRSDMVKRYHRLDLMNSNFYRS